MEKLDLASRRIAILGAGPIGLEAALYARTLGCAVTVYESSSRIAGNVRSWGHVQLFTPWPMNVSRLGWRRIREEAPSAEEWAAAACPTGTELVDRYLDPLCHLPEMQGVVRVGTRVVAAGRSGLLKGDAIAATGDDRRRGRPFVLLLRNTEGGPGALGDEWYEEADVVLDATGVYGQPNHLGRSGLPAPGEEMTRSHLLYGTPDLASAERDRVVGRDILVVGGGLSAATTICALAQASVRSVVWVTRAGTPPMQEITDDPLPSRLQLTRKANALAKGEKQEIAHLGGSEVVSVARHGVRTIVEIAPIGTPTPAASSTHPTSFPETAEGVFADRPPGLLSRRRFEVDTVIVQTGFHPDNGLYRELQVHECYASQGPMNLAAALLGASGGDCMTQSGHGPESLTIPEPDFFMIGNKSYGRNRSFLLRIGREQVRDVFRLLAGDPNLELV